ncbi:MAG TPA: hypothetical protein VK454_13150, partial [Myxococcaceae bacterium]|nr:hypothetical protein [Myxococcaceae bacterium]
LQSSELLQSLPLAPEELEALLRSLSFLAPALGPARMDALVGRALALAERHGGARWERVLLLSWGRSRAVRRAGR